MSSLLIAEYERMLLNNIDEPSRDLFPYSPEINMRLALDVFRYSLEKYLRWDPFTVRDMLTYDIIDKLKLRGFMQYIIFPVELNPETDLFFIAWSLYPKTIHISQRDMVLNVYKRILNGETNKYPKEFYTGTMGEIRAIICLRYMIEEYFQFESVEAMYEHFGSSKINAELKKYKLDIICKDVFGNPVDYLHASLSEKQQDDFLYHFYRFEYIRKQARIGTKFKTAPK